MAGKPSEDYWLLATGEDSAPGIHGALQTRQPNWPTEGNTFGMMQSDPSALPEV